jgi:hypothetical protein
MTTRAPGPPGPSLPLLAGLLLALAGCPRVPPADQSRDPVALLEQVRAAQERVQRVRGSARLKVASPRLSGSVNAFAAAEKPDRLQLTTLDFFGNPVTVLAAAGGRFGLWDARDGVYYRGEATPENVSRLLPVMLPLEELVAILCGSAPLLQGAPVEVGEQDGFVLLTLGQGPVGQRLALGEGAAVAWSRVRRRVGEGGAARDVPEGYDLAFGAFRRRDGVSFPGEARLGAAAKAKVELTWRDDVEVNGDPTPALFRLEPPRGARVVELPAGASPPDLPFPADPPRE